MGLGDNDQILAAGVNQGIGNSGLVAQESQRNNIEDNNNLRQALATSQATMQNEQEQRLAEARASMAKNQYQIQSQMLTRGAGQRAGNAGGGVSGVVMFANNFGDTFASNGGAPNGGSQRGFSLTIPDSTGRAIPKLFTSIDDLKSYIANTPGLENMNLVMPGVPLGISAEESKGLMGLGVQNVTPEEAKRASGIYTRKIVGDPNAAMGNRNINQRHDAKTQSQLDIMTAGGKVDFAKLPSYAQAQLIDGGFETVNTVAKAIRNPSNVADFNSLGESEQIIHAIAGEKDLAKRAAMTKYAIENGIISSRRRG